MAEARRSGRTDGGRRGQAAVTLASLAAYALLVSGSVGAWIARADRRACVDPHALGDTGLLVAGVALGLVWGAAATDAAVGAADVLLPTVAPERRRAAVRALAALVLVLGAGMNVLWIVPALNLFVDVHTALRIEVEVLVYLMGALAGAAWYALLGRQGWIGVLVTAAMGLMTVGSVLSQHAWC
jgi:hypothetical protein